MEIVRASLAFDLSDMDLMSSNETPIEENVLKASQIRLHPECLSIRKVNNERLFCDTECLMRHTWIVRLEKKCEYCDYICYKWDMHKHYYLCKETIISCHGCKQTGKRGHFIDNRHNLFP